MGALISILREGYLSIMALLQDISDTSTQFNAVLNRISSPTLPSTASSVPMWHSDPPFPDLINIRSDKFPSDADIVIIGSGISGASLAYTILTECQTLGIAKKVVMLEARQICSGATGRNGGHLKCTPYAEYCGWKKRFGGHKARKLLDFQMKHLPTILDLVRRENLAKAEAREVETVDVFIYEEAWQKAKDMVAELKADLPDVARGIEVWEAVDAREKFKVGDTCHGAISYTAGAMWPYRLVTSIYSLLISRFPSSFSIETTTVAESVRSSGHQTQPFRVHTSRGEIAAEHVIHATDSFASNLIPGLTGKLFPVRGHMSAQRPGTAFPKLNGSRSWSLIGQKGFEYITQRPDSADDPLANALMAGGGVVQSENRGLDELGIWRDDQTSTPIRAYLDGILPVAFGPENWGDDQCPSRLIQLWTGCMGFTLDLLPYVGHLDARLTHRPVPKPTSSSSSETEGILSSPAPAEWISAGFNGEGMVSAWLSGVAVALMVLGREDVPNTTNACGRPAGRMDTWFPEELRCSKRRLDSASIYDFARWI